ncbi:MAG: N-4 cytosine-specific DNA methylase [Cenarchaeum symbiont of Oopsacas minuta]|nr:N-4 cytosine-specific DNA methylase [Cenarchaeum symbiont of Oopsacas minuta]
MTYKTVAISTEKWDVSDVRTDIKLFNDELSPNAKIVMDKKTHDVRLQLHRIDMQKLKRTIKSFKTCKELGEKIIDEINSIGSYGIRNGMRQYVEYNTERKVKGRKNKIQKRNPVYYSKLFDKSNVELPKKYLDKILCADSLKQLKKLPDNCIDVIFTSPPYNFGLEYENTGDDSEKWTDYFNKLFEIFTECIRVLKHGGRIAINIQPLFSDYIPAHHIISNFFIAKGLIWKGEILWEKNNYNCKYTAWGSWKSPSSPYLKYTWEFVEVFCKGNLKKEGDKANADVLGDDFKKWVYAKWSISPERKMKKYDHPAMFPEELVKRVLQLFSFKNDIVLDPFVGAGTTCVVAKKTGRHYVGIDISKEYVRTSINRLDSILS